MQYFLSFLSRKKFHDKKTPSNLLVSGGIFTFSSKKKPRQMLDDGKIVSHLSDTIFDLDNRLYFYYYLSKDTTF